MEKLKIGIIGIGRWGKRLADVFGKHAEIAYLIHKGSLDTKEWANLHFPSAILTDNLDLILSDKSVKAVVVATPIDTHFEIALKALKAGKHVFLEKPGTESSDKLQKLIEEAENKNLILQIGYEFVFADEILEMRKIIMGGTVKRISFYWKKMGTFDFHPIINLLVHELSILKAIGIYDVHLGKYSEVIGEHKPDKIHLDAKSGSIDISFDIDRVSEIKEKSVTILTESDVFEWKDGRTQLIDKEVGAFVDSVINNTIPVVDGHFAKEILETIEKINY